MLFVRGFCWGFGSDGMVIGDLDGLLGLDLVYMSDCHDRERF